MSRSVSTLTPSSLTAALEAIAASRNEDDCAVAITSAAAHIQEAVLAGITPKELLDAIDSCPETLAKELGTTVDRAVSFCQLDDGSMLGLWLLPVVVSRPVATASIIPLETESINGLKATSYIQAQMGVNRNRGWTYVMPMLLSSEQVKQADIGALIKLPHQAMALVRGQTANIKFVGDASVPAPLPGAALYFLPFITRHAPGVAVEPPAADERVMHRVQKWISDSLTAQSVDLTDFAIHVAPTPESYAAGMPAGERIFIDVRIREMMTGLCDQLNVLPNALAALVAPYVTKQMDDTYVLGVSLVSRLTGAYMATLSMQVDYDDPHGHIVGMTSRILNEMGMQVIQLRHDPIQTVSCQHCGNLQYAVPVLNPNLSLTNTAQKVH
ncbi:UDP-N-acetylmuramoyl-tripeptide--D-alanyl-D-alanine ligase [Novimethylophilus kurashikiensis]|uniref:UDP-N-acetylmuramoyl-tripeptide--D-alanyl-D-alanine ligase n=1 Tax=Novimethylophilus kurashikiensis TaxID=1825523 RepID=A0A2R5F7Y5_9PROT|nr:hypothetical protein [Novimethylophilus kurashikiensis]GBG14352.1 UDP-N-acetylmuramoyl-tripeptide--D-alanyl-D-alanine ligase [Novimethylophilus kurashikiensis]